jgi:RNA polymerase sigma-70 factor (ECF subfamily)
VDLIMAHHHVADDEDQEFLHALRSQDEVEAFFHQLVRRYQRRLLSFFSHRGLSPEVCRDLSQETYLRVYRSREQFRGEVPLSSWIFQIAANLYLNEIRRHQTGKRSGQEQSLDAGSPGALNVADTGGEPVQTAAPAPPLARALWREKLQAVGGAIDQLAPQGRRALQMRVRHGYSVAEIAAVMKISESTVKVHLHQARKRLREVLQNRFGEIPF